MGPFAARFAPVPLMVGAKVPYSVIQKLTPPEVDAFSSLCLTYGVCTACAVVFFFLTQRGAGGSGRTLRGEWSKATWTAPVFGACLLCMDVATLAMFRVGWDLSVGMLVLFVVLGCVLALVGSLFYGERLTARRLAGILLSVVGVVLVGM